MNIRINQKTKSHTPQKIANEIIQTTELIKSIHSVIIPIVPKVISKLNADGLIFPKSARKSEPNKFGNRIPMYEAEATNSVTTVHMMIIHIVILVSVLFFYD